MTPTKPKPDDDEKNTCSRKHMALAIVILGLSVGLCATIALAITTARLEPLTDMRQDLAEATKRGHDNKTDIARTQEQIAAMRQTLDRIESKLDNITQNGRP